MTIDAGRLSDARVSGRSLTGEQEDAVQRRRGSLLLAANAGSGKTTVLVERFVRAVHEDGVAPSRILAITFTERAAAELRQRVRWRLHELDDRGAARATEAAFVSTIHGFCVRLLSAHPLAAGLAAGFRVLDEGTAADLRDRAFERALAGWLTGEPALELVAACGVDRLGAAIRAVHDELRSRGRTRPELPKARPRHDREAARAALLGAGAALARELDAPGSPRAGRRVAAALVQLEGDLQGAAPSERKLHRGAGALRSAAADAYEAARLSCCEAEADAAGMVGLELLGRLLEGYAREFAGLKRAQGALDFDDLELSARDLLEREPEIRGRWAQRFELLMVDELQDTNPREMAILEALDRDNLFTVGDEFQSIYGFRHADVGIFRRRRRDLEGADCVRVLSRNFRTRPPLLRAINAAFAPLFGRDFVPLVAGRRDGPDGEPLLELLLSDSAGWEQTAAGGELGTGPAWRRAEAALLARRIEELIDAGAARPGEVVVLLRYATAAAVYEQALLERGVPVAAAPGSGFYAAQEVADLGAYARVLANPLDDEALYGVLASPLCGLDADGLAILGLAARAVGLPPWEVLAAACAGDPAAGAALAPLTAVSRGLLEACHGLIAGERRAAPRLGPAELLVRCGYRERALGGPGAEPGLANVEKLVRLAREFEAREGPDLRRFADRLTAGRLGSTREPEAGVAETDAVHLMTVHAAKGLEFPVVCLGDLGHGPPNLGPLVLTDGERVGLRLPTLEAPRVDAFAYAELRAGREAATVAEEQRIVYVAMTRARERLILSGAANFARWPAPGAASPAIAWLAPALVDDLPGLLAGPAGTREVELGGARLRLTLTAAGEMPWLGDGGPQSAAVVPGSTRLGRAAADGPSQISQLGAGGGPRAAQKPTTAAPAPAVASADAAPPPAASAPATPPPSSVSYSSLADYARCGYGYYLRRVVGLAEVTPPRGTDPTPVAEVCSRPPGPEASPDAGPGPSRAGVVGRGLDAAERGRIVHALLERLDFARPDAPPQALMQAQAQAASLEPEAAEVSAIAELVRAFGRSPLCARLARADAVSREASFGLTVGELLVGGYIDVLAREAGGGMLVVDYKTDRVDPDTDLAGRVAADYEVQRRIYALAALRAGAAWVEVAYCFLRRPEEVVCVRYGAGEADGLERELGALAAPLLAGLFAVSPQPHRGLCATCPGRAGLCSWDEVMTLRRVNEQGAVQDA